MGPALEIWRNGRQRKGLILWEKTIGDHKDPPPTPCFENNHHWELGKGKEGDQTECNETSTENRKWAFSKEHSRLWFNIQWGQTGLHESLQPCSRAARKWRENEEMRRKWRENEEMERDWLSTFPHSLSISSLFLHFLPLFPFPTSKCITFCCKMLNTALLSRMSQKSQHTRYEEIILGRTCCEEAPQFVPACQRTILLLKALYFFPIPLVFKCSEYFFPNPAIGLSKLLTTSAGQFNCHSNQAL